MNNDETPTNDKCSKDEVSSNFDSNMDTTKSDLNKLNCDDPSNNYTNQLHVPHQISQQQFNQPQQQRQQISPIDRYIIDKDGLNLALNYFTSSTLTMRLSGIAQINSYINLFNECLQAENSISSLRHSEGEQFVEWILSNKIIEHIFGPNLHVEVIKQSQTILNFVVSHLTPQQIDVIWSASQLKHCSKQVFDIVMPLIKNMNIPTVLHLYSLLKNLDIKEHTEHTLCLASYLLKYIWAKSFNINESPINQNISNQLSNNLLLAKKNYPQPFLFVTPNYDYMKEASEDSSVSASMVEDDTSEDEEEVSASFIKDQQSVQRPLVTEVGGGDSSCASLDDENKQDEVIVTTAPNEVFNKSSANHQPKLKSHRQVFSQQTFQTTQQQTNFETPQPVLTADYLEKKGNDASSESEFDVEMSDVCFKEKRKQKRSADNNFAGCFKKGESFNLKIPDDDDEMYDSEEDQHQVLTQDNIYSRLMKFRQKASKNPKLAQSANSDSISSQFSEKNMNDFDDGEESDASGSDQIELDNQKELQQRFFNRESNFIDQMSASPTKNYFTHSLINLANLQQRQNQAAIHSTKSLLSFESEIAAELVKFSLDNVCRPGQTLLWDLLQDDSIRYLSDGLALNCEKILYNLICWLSDKRLRMKFIEGCMDNISQNRSVIISLRLLPKLLMSFDQQRAKNEIHTLTMMVEKERNLLKNFFSNLVQYTEKYKYYSRLKINEENEATTTCSSNLDLNVCYEQPHKIRKTSESHQDKSTSPFVDRSKTTIIQTDQSSSSQSTNVLYEQTCYEFFSNMLYSHQEEIQTRLHFLSTIFSSNCSPEIFQLDRDQIDILWYCLAYDPECRDELFSWLLNQVRTKEQHALCNDMLEYILENKMPCLTPDSYTMIALELLQGLSNNIFIRKQQELMYNRKLDQAIFNSQQQQQQTQQDPSKGSSNNNNNKIDITTTDNDQWKIASIAIKQLWNIALKAINTDVSMAAIRNLNNYYVHLQSAKTLDKEEEFIKQCMDYLTFSSRSLRDDEEKNLTVIQRALVLLKTHLETFRCRYSYHFRLMQLNGDQTITSHRNKLSERLPQQLIKIFCQISSLNEKVIFEMNYNDYVGELRAQITNWWTKVMDKIKSDHEVIANKKINLNFDGPLRLLSQGQEITYNLDEKTLVEMNFKEGQIVYITTSVNNKQTRRKEILETKLPDPPKNKLPFILLLDPIYFDQLFDLLQQLGSMKETFCAGRAQVLSRRVWEIINLLPTSPNLMKCFKNIALIRSTSSASDKEDVGNEKLPSLNSLLDPKSPQKLIYSLQIVDYLQKVRDEDINGQSWLKYFVDYGGLNHLFDIFISGVLQQGESNSWNEWKQDCLAFLLQLIYQIGINSLLNDNNSDCENNIVTKDSKSTSSGTEVSKYPQQEQQAQHQTRRRKFNRTNDKLIVHQFNNQLLSMLNDADQVLQVILTILSETCSVSKNDNIYYQTGFWGRTQIVLHTFTFLTSWLFSDPSIHINLFNFTMFKGLLRMLVLEDSDPSVRREVCTCLYRLCLGNSKNGKIGYLFIPHLLNIMLTFLPIAQQMKPYKNQVQDEICYIEKESFGPGCKDYFWLIYQLVDSLEPDTIATIGNEDGKVDLENLCVYLAQAIESLEIRETRNLSIEDESLRGLLMLMSVSLKHNPPYKRSDSCRTFLHIIFNCLFAHPNAKDRNLPKCKQQSTRSAAFDLLLEMIKDCEDNQKILIDLLYKQHTLTSHNTYVWDYWPHDDCRSEYVGLLNLGATCYMASCVQHLFMFPKVRQVILSSKISKNTKNAPVLIELQRMFVFLLESERKAYNPKNFCKVYTMDNQPLNTGEQKDMTEFFTDLISKLEDMSSELKNTLRELFAGTLSNNVVSLDCPHISRTTEEFYTLRCKVADMRNLYDSLDELTVKDTLEGDNMYTCSQCGKKVRAEKRACIKKLPEILCLNTLRYTFNMVTMTKEKVNTHFSFPMRIDLSPYLEENLIRNDDNKQQTPQKKSNQDALFDSFEQPSCSTNQQTTSTTEQQNIRKRLSKDESSSITTTANDESNQYELIGVTVHTGTADGGHYYCFIREPDESKGKDKWYIFNDAEVHAFDPNQLASECFGGEMTSKTYDSVNDKFMDFAIEKTNSAYMLFYKRIARSTLWAGSSSKTDLSESQNSTQSSLAAIKSSSQQLNKLIQQAKQCEIVYEIPKELNDWIWEDNIQFIKDKYIFEHTYFNFMWQVCAIVPQTMNNSQNIMLPCAQLATAFVIETLIHSKEKPTIASWIELLTKQFNASLEACEWLIDHIAENYLHWPVDILLRCPNQMVRQLFQRLCAHVITELKKSQQNLYLKYADQSSIDSFDEQSNELKLSDESVQQHQQNQQKHRQSAGIVKLESMQNLESIDNLLPNYGRHSCVTRLIRKLLLLIKCNNNLVRPHLKHLTEYFNLLYEFTKMGEIECEFMLKMETISIIVQFYLSHLSHCKANGEILEIVSEDEEELLSEFDEEQIDPIVSAGPSTSNASPNFSFYRNNQIIGSLAQSFKELQQEKYTKPASLDKMISFVAFLVDKSRNSNGKLCISPNDMEALVGKNFAFINRQIRDNINLRQTFNLICTLCMNNDKMTAQIINMILASINRQPETSQPFFIILSMLVELNNQQQTISSSASSATTSSMHSFGNNIYPKIWEIAEQNPLHTLEWLTVQVPRNENLHSIIMDDLNKWMEYFLIAHPNQRVRQATAYLIISLVPNNVFRQTYKSHKFLMLQSKENLELTEEATNVVRKIFSSLLDLLKVSRQYVDIQVHGTSKLTSYFALMFYCLLSKKEKLMLVPYFNDLWNLFQPKLSEPAVAVNQNKQALLFFWYQACIDCPENVQCIIQNSQVTKNIAFNYILADHDDQEVVIFNRIMLPSYYGLLGLCCMQSRSFTRQLAVHQNIIWAFKNITPYYTQYQSAVNELFKLMKLFIQTFEDTTEQELEEIQNFKRNTILTYLNSVDQRSCWTTTITAFSILLENDEDKVFAISNNTIHSLYQSFSILFMMFHEATACHITNEIVEVLRIITGLLKTLSKELEQPKMQEFYSKWKDRSEFIKKPIHLLNTFTPSEVRIACMDFLMELIKLFPKECIPVTVQLLGLVHLTFQEQYMNFSPGPYFPRLGQNPTLTKSSLRPTRPIFQMHFHPKMLQVQFGKDKAYDNNLKNYYLPYYNFIANICKIALRNNIVNQELVGFCSMVALESLVMRVIVFPNLWFEMINSIVGDNFINMLCSSCHYFKEYINLVLTSERDFLQNDVVFQLVKHCLPKINPPILTPQYITKLISIDCSINLSLEEAHFVKKYFEILSYLRSLLAIFSNDITPKLLTDEHKVAITALKAKLTNFTVESGSSSSDIEMPQKRRKPNEEEQTSITSQEESTAAKVVETLNNNLNKTKNDLKAVILASILELVKLFEFQS